MDLLQQERFATVTARTRHIDELYEELSTIMQSRSTSEWLALLDPADLPVTPLNGPDDLLAHPQLEATGFWQVMQHPSEGPLRMTDQPVGFSASPGTTRRPPPRLGEHSLEVLREAGLEGPEIDAMLAAGITRGADQADA